MRHYLTNTGNNLYGGWWYTSANFDNQSEGSACRPAVFSSIPLNYEDVDFMSGGDEAYRYPAGASLFLNYTEGGVAKQQKLMLIAFHATSGYNANVNCNALFDRCYDEDFLDSPSVWIVGGDFNCDPGYGPSMPNPDFTHQSGHTLDGFFADQNRSAFCVQEAVPAATYTAANGGVGQLILEGAGNPHGYVVPELVNPANNMQISDHCPVRARLRVDVDVRAWKFNPTAVITGGPATRANRGTNPKRQAEHDAEAPAAKKRKT
jgi:hypothetical protein